MSRSLKWYTTSDGTLVNLHEVVTIKKVDEYSSELLSSWSIVFVTTDGGSVVDKFTDEVSRNKVYNNIKYELSGAFSKVLG